ncbi:hypothetical protein DFH08DRAFT_1086887 [Mycena albidolilacea]|uniref:Uncharacterized protein n=1 Tax=Mycena albidolilacea TaxID=1033008 RepID=A0AAD6ZBR8_9AGAR|nr:hypothetical protein DFH08DRAFT_1086887 [Mycena albidolilacea]
MDIPQELIATIIQEVDDHLSLKMCSLAGKAFCAPAQRMLLTSLDLRVARPYTAALDLLDKSPHIASYFKRLYCPLPEASMAEAEVDALCTVLGKLSNVRHCHFVAATNIFTLWTEFLPNVYLAVVEFTQRQRLAELEIDTITAIPSDVLALFLGAAPTVSLVNSNVDSAVTLMHSLAPPPPIVETLRVSWSPGIADVLTSPDFRPYMHNIRKLWWDPDIDTGGRLIALVSHTLEHLCIQFFDQTNWGKTIKLPPLPRVKSVEVTLEQEWLVPVYYRFLTILTAAPDTLEEICITFAPKPDFLHPEALGQMDSIFTGSAASPRVRWRLDLKDNPISSFAGFVGALERGLPILHAQGKLVVERSSVTNTGLSAWAGRK